jgi:catechol 2,3-dioxygenase-like lactoylglutathione lyase family enzyme
VKAHDLFHIGIVTDDLDESKDRLTSVLGYEWGPEIGGPVDVDWPSGGAATVEIRCAYSITVPRLELVRSVPGTFWSAAGSGLHHVGYWSDDVSADVGELTDEGYELEVTRAGQGGGLFFAFLRSTAGFRVELVDRRAQPSIERCWAAPAATLGP